MIVAMYGIMPMPRTANAVDALANSTWLISDTDFEQTATSTFTFDTGTSTEVGGFIKFTFPAGFTGIAAGNVNCDSGDADFTASSTGNVVECVRSNTTQAAASLSMVITDVVNPSDQATDYYTVDIEHYRTAAGSSLQERVQVMVQLLDDVLMTARVDATLQFNVTGLNGGSDTVNSVSCTGTTTSNTLPFGTLQPAASSTVCQELDVTTNASNGFTVTVWQDQELTSDGNDNINSFNDSPDGTGSTTATSWQPPSGQLDSDHTYGHMGLTSDDTDLNSLGGYEDLYNGAGAPEYVGLDGITPRPIFHHDGPADGSTQDRGVARVAYTAEIHALQQAGDYESTLTYVATPTY